MNKTNVKIEKSKKKLQKKCMILIRVSTAKQKKGTSPKTQKKWGNRRAGELKAVIVTTINVGISGKNWLKEYEGKILDTIIREKLDYVLVFDISRFTRKLSLGVETLNKILALGCAIVTSSEIIDAKTDLFMSHVEMAVAEHNRINIVEKGKQGILSLLAEGKYPFSHIPLGIIVNTDKHSINYRDASFDPKFTSFMMDLHISIDITKNFAKTAEEISQRYIKILDKPLSAEQVKGILTNPIYIGFFPFMGERVGKGGSNKIPHSQLIGITLKCFNKTQKTVAHIFNKKRKNGLTPLHDGLSDLIETYGFDVVINNTDDMLRLCCKKCRSLDLDKNGPEVITGHYTEKYTCKKCGHQFRFPSTTQLKNLRCVDPRRCPRCGSADDFTVTSSVLSDYFQVTCNKCKYTWLAPVTDSKFKKLFDQQQDDKI